MFLVPRRRCSTTTSSVFGREVEVKSRERERDEGEGQTLIFAISSKSSMEEEALAFLAPFPQQPLRS